jgi:small-conductance mechanosensitive channel
MSTQPPAPETSPRSQLTSALVWTIGAVAIAAFAFIRGADGGEKRNFWFILGAMAVIAALYNGYGAWVAFKQTKTTPQG